MLNINDEHESKEISVDISDDDEYYNFKSIEKKATIRKQKTIKIRNNNIEYDIRTTGFVLSGFESP